MLYELADFIKNLMIIYIAWLVVIAPRRRIRVMDKSKLLAPLMPEDEVELPGKGTVKVRALSKKEVHDINSKTKDGADKALYVEYKMIVAAVIDPPDLDINDVKEWFSTSAAGETKKVLAKIMEISGMQDEDDLKAAQEEAYKSFRE